MQYLTDWLKVFENLNNDEAYELSLKSKNKLNADVDKFTYLVENKRMIDIVSMNEFYEKFDIGYRVIKNYYYVLEDDIYFNLMNRKYKSGNYITEDRMFEILRDPVNKNFKEIKNFIEERIIIMHNIGTEYFKPMFKYEKIYEVSNYGRVLSIKTNILLKQRIGKDNYYSITIWGKKYRSRNKTHIHSCMARTFLIKPESNKKLEVDHINGNKLDNRLVNLRYLSGRKNSLNSYITGNKKPFCKIVCKYDKNRKFLKKYSSAKKASDDTKIASQNILACCKYNTTTHKNLKKAGGFIWKFSKLNKENKINIRRDEIFKPITKIKNNKFINYEASNDGNVRNIKTNRILRPAKHSVFYRVVLQTDKYKSNYNKLCLL